MRVKRTAIGVRMHSGWGVVVAVSGDAHSWELLDRRRIITADRTIPGFRQPYHRAAKLRLPEAEEYLARCAAASKKLTVVALEDIGRELHELGLRITVCAVLQASGRPLPALPSILASHPLIHTAEGVFFRDAVTAACDQIHIAATQIRERDLGELADDVLGKSGRRLRDSIAGSRPGPPWTADHKNAALGALLALQTRRPVTRSGRSAQRPRR
jgi:hypothetical protein